MKITIFWTGYVGLVTGTCLAEVGHEVMCIDTDSAKIQNLNNGLIPIYEPWLSELTIRNQKAGRIIFSDNAIEWIKFASVIMSTVGTPLDKNNRADLQYVKMVAKTIGKYMNEYKVFINKSTVPVGTGAICKDIIQSELNERGVMIEFDIVSNPEFLKEWSAVKDFMMPDRIICGLSGSRSRDIMEIIYMPFIRTNKPIIFTSLESSEVIKYAANAFLATRISFINEIANFAELVGANISDISRWIGMDERIGPRFLHAGIGYGGPCLSKDIQSFIETGKDVGYDFKIIQATQLVNNKQKMRIIDKLMYHIPNLEWKIIAILGLTFKPKTDDIRNSVSHSIINSLLEKWVSEIHLFDPIGMQSMAQIYSQESRIIFSENSYQAMDGADALVILTEWDEFRAMDIHQVKLLLRNPIVIDGRNIWNRLELESLGFIYEGIGK